MAWTGASGSVEEKYIDLSLELTRLDERWDVTGEAKEMTSTNSPVRWVALAFAEIREIFKVSVTVKEKYKHTSLNCLWGIKEE